METALDVLTRAATMVQDNADADADADESRATTKELPTAAWRRERRTRTAEYHNNPHHNNASQYSPAISGHVSTQGSSSPTSSPSPSPSSPLPQLSSLPPTVALSAQHQYSSTSNPQLRAHPCNISASSYAHQMHGITMPTCTAANGASAIPIVKSIGENANTITASTAAVNAPPVHSRLGRIFYLDHLAHEQMLNQIPYAESDDRPLDMSLPSFLKQRNSPPPPYREPFAGTTYATSLARPSVITQAPPKREMRESMLQANREIDNRSSESIDEHFRRSLGNDYFTLFGKKSPRNPPNKAPSPQDLQQQQIAMQIATKSPSPTHTSDVLPYTAHVTHTSPRMPSNTPFTQPAYHHLLTGPVAHQHQQQQQQLDAMISTKFKTTEAALVDQTDDDVSQVVPLSLQKTVGSAVAGYMTSAPASYVAAITTISTTTNIVKAPALSFSPHYNCAQEAHNASGHHHHHHHTILSSATTRSALSTRAVASMEESPTTSPRHTPPKSAPKIPLNSFVNLPGIMQIKIEPDVHNLKQHENAASAISPTNTLSSTASINTNSADSNSNLSNECSSSASALASANNTTTTKNTSVEILASVDDHFAKALGDTWRKLQENKDIHK